MQTSNTEMGIRDSETEMSLSIWREWFPGHSVVKHAVSKLRDVISFGSLWFETPFSSSWCCCAWNEECSFAAGYHPMCTPSLIASQPFFRFPNYFIASQAVACVTYAAGQCVTDSWFRARKSVHCTCCEFLALKISPCLLRVELGSTIASRMMSDSFRNQFEIRSKHAKQILHFDRCFSRIRCAPHSWYIRANHSCCCLTRDEGRGKEYSRERY